jgi:nicotinamidase-related amidase
MAQRLAALKKRAKRAGIPAIYVNDNFGRWQSDLNQVLDHVLHDGVPGRPLAELLRPEEDDYFVLKPKHSGFYSTQLDILLRYLGARTLVLTGIQANICVLFTANDAYMRDYAIVIPSDCVASADPAEAEHAVKQMRTALKALVAPSTEIDLEALIADAGGQAAGQEAGAVRE